MKANFKKLVSFLVLIFTLAGPAAAGSVSMRIVFENPSEIEEKKDVFKSYLPPEIRKEDVLDLGGLQLDYDAGRSLFYVFIEASLQPKESKTFKLMLENVWKIADEEINFVKNQTHDRLKSLEGGPDFENAKMLHDQIIASLEQIQLIQSAPEKDAMKSIEAYRINKERLKSIRSHVTLSKDFKQEAEIEADNIKYPKEIKYVVNAKNASSTETRTQTITNYLPEGMRPEYFIDFQGFEIKFDEEKKLYYLTQKIELKPGETKKFQIRINDRWNIAKQKLDNFQTKAEELVEFLKNSEFKEASNYLLNDIKHYIQEIVESQSKATTIKDRIANYIENIKKVEAIKIDLAELERMAEVERERLKKQQLEDLLKKLAPDEFLTWKIIYGTIAFLGVISFLTYILWWGQTKSKLNKEFEDITSGQQQDKKK